MQTDVSSISPRELMESLPAALPNDLAVRMQRDREQGWLNPWRCDDGAAVRRYERADDISTPWRPAFVRDTEKIIHTPAYNRYAGKTQVFSFRSNDDLSRRGLHVQLVARIARDIGNALGLNTDLIEAIGLGHDLGHTPFGHAGERFLNTVFHARTGRYFYHNVHSVRVMDKLYGRNVSLQTLDGALCHNGEYEQRTFRVSDLSSFAELDQVVESCYVHGSEQIKHLQPMTLEGCVVRICDIVAYVGRDRQDAVAAGLLSDDDFEGGLGGVYNSLILTHASLDIIQNSYGKDRIEMSEALFGELARAKRENYEKIYSAGGIEGACEDMLLEAFELVYERCLDDLRAGDENSYIFRHFIRRIEAELSHYGQTYDWQASYDQTVADYIASMTDGYFIELSCKLFPQLSFPQRTYINER